MQISAVLHFIRTHVAMKLGLLLLSVFLLIIFSIGNILYSLFLSFYTTHMTEELMQRADSHAVVLGSHFTESTIAHVVEMERGSNFSVVILGKDGQALANSEPITDEHQKYLKLAKEGESIADTMERDWSSSPFLVSRAAIMHGEQEIGTVVLFSPTAPIRQAVEVLQVMMAIIGVITVLLVAGILFVISRMMVLPLLEMKKVTGEIAKGKYKTRLPIRGEDEVAQLAYSINYMSDEISFYQKQRNEFLADIGHELRTPITYLKGYSEILLHHQMSEEETKDYLKIIHEQSTRLQRLVQDLFDLARMERGDFSFQKEPLFLDEVVTDVLSFIESSMDAKGIHLEYDPPEKLSRVCGDRQRLQQVLINILENARRYTPQGGSVHIRYEIAPQHITAVIEDTGHGIPKEELPFIMERLYRVEKSRSQETGGAGLGLAISKKIIEMHKGEIRVESQEGQGTSFFIRLPLAENQPSWDRKE